MSVLASATSEAMNHGRVNSGRLPDERFHTDSVFNAISRHVEASRALTWLRTRESETGADALLYLGGPAGYLRFAIQAKKLQSHKVADPLENANPPHYPELGHSSGGMRQYDRLLRAVAPGGLLEGYIPIHIFYNELTCSFDVSGGWLCESVFRGDDTEFGISYAHTRDVKTVAEGLLASGGRGPKPRFPYEAFKGICRPWLCLLCPFGGGCVSTGDHQPWAPFLNPRRESEDPAAGPSLDETDPEASFVTPETADDATRAMIAVLDSGERGDLVEARQIVRRRARSALIVNLGQSSVANALNLGYGRPGR